MSARSPFRSHLLQQWTSSRRSPIVVQQWLQQATSDEEEEGFSTASVSARRHRERNRRSLHHSCNQHGPSMSSVDSSPSGSLAATTPWAVSLKSHDDIKEANHRENELSSIGLSVSLPLDDKLSQRVESDNEIIANGKQKDVNFQRIMLGSDFLYRSATKPSPDALHEMATHRKVVTNECGMPSMKNKINYPMNPLDLSSTSNNTQDSNTQRDHRREKELKMAIDRAITFSKTANVRNRHLHRAEAEPPFSFRKMLSSSRSGRQLIDICFRVTLKTTNDEFLARKERKRWSKAPAFLVAIAHNNQKEVHLASISTKLDDNDENYKALDYSPPINERQLEDYASACSTVQSVIYSLDKDGFATEVREIA